jgi:hypothetical protein
VDRDPSDEADIRFLLAHLEITTPEAALAVVGRFYPPDRVPARTAYLLEAILAKDRP